MTDEHAAGPGAEAPVRKGKGRLKAAAAGIGAKLAAGETDSVRAFLDVQALADIATLLEYLPQAEALAALRLLPPRSQAETLGYLRPKVAVRLTDAMERGALAALMAEMSHDERADLYKALPAKTRAAVLPAMAQAERDDLRRLAEHAEETAGAIMTSDYATLLAEMTAPEALEALRRQAIESETVYVAYVVDADHRLRGRVRLRDVLVAPSSETVGEIMDPNPVSIAVDADQEETAALISRYDLIALPVIDATGRLVGIVTHDDAMDVAEAEATEDFLKGSTVEPVSGRLGDAGIFTLYRARIVWLVLLVFGNIFSGAGISYFEDTIAGNLALLFFLPLLIGSGGNAGAQSATLMVRALATGDVAASDWLRLIVREVGIALLLGLTMALAVSVIGVVRAGPAVTVAVALSMVIIVLAGALIGMSLPFLLSKFKLDPATASGPLVTSIADVLGVLIYFSIAGAVLAP